MSEQMAADALGDVERVRRRVRGDLSGMWFPLVLFGAAFLASVPAIELLGGSRVGLYWAIVGIAGGSATGWFYRRRQIELGAVRGGRAYIAIAVVVLVGALGIAAVGERIGFRDLTFFGPSVVVALGYLGWARLERSAALAAVVVALLALETALIAVGTDRLTAARVLALAWGSTLVLTGLAYAVRNLRP